MRGIRLPAPKVFTNHQIILALFFWILHSFNKLCSKVSCFLILEGSFNFQTLLLNTWGGALWMSGWEETHLIPIGRLMIQKQAWS